MATLDSLELPCCHFIKLDAEGMEAQVLTGAAQTTKRQRPALYVENDRKDRSVALLGTPLGMGYQLYWHLPKLFNPNDFFGEVEILYGNTLSVDVLDRPKGPKQNFKLAEIRGATDESPPAAPRSRKRGARHARGRSEDMRGRFGLAALRPKPALL